MQLMAWFPGKWRAMEASRAWWERAASAAPPTNPTPAWQSTFTPDTPAGDVRVGGGGMGCRGLAGEGRGEALAWQRTHPTPPTPHHPLHTTHTTTPTHPRAPGRSACCQTATHTPATHTPQHPPHTTHPRPPGRSACRQRGRRGWRRCRCRPGPRGSTPSTAQSQTGRQWAWQTARAARTWRRAGRRGRRLRTGGWGGGVGWRGGVALAWRRAGHGAPGSDPPPPPLDTSMHIRAHTPLHSPLQ